jgi:hypothetical protein
VFFQAPLVLVGHVWVSVCVLEMLCFMGKCVLDMTCGWVCHVVEFVCLICCVLWVIVSYGGTCVLDMSCLIGDYVVKVSMCCGYAMLHD